jgi:oxaloacetate decarboxylase beta subunit
MSEFINLIQSTGFFHLDWRMLVMWIVVAVLLYLAVRHNFEPLLLVPIAFGALLANLPTEGMTNKPAGRLVSPVNGTVVAVNAELQRKVVMPIVPIERVGHLTKFGDEAGLVNLFEEENAIENLDERTLVAVIRPDRGDPELLQQRIAVPFNDTTIEVSPEDYLVWAEATGSVSASNIVAGQKVSKGEALVEVYSAHTGGLYHYISLGILLELFPPLIFLGVGALTDFGPLIANPRTLLLGAAAQFGVFATFIGAILLGFSKQAAGAIGIIGGADGPTSIFLANALAPDLLAPIAVAAYSYMALVPLIQPPIMTALTTKKERKIRMKSLRKVSKLEKLIFALVVTVFCILLVPPASPLIGMLLLGNFLRECGVTERLSKAAQNELINVVTIFLGTSVGITMTGERFLRAETLKILALGVIAFGVSTAAGILMAKLMNLFSKNKINPLIGSAGVSAVPMAARVSQVEGQKYDPNNFLLMHAMGPNVAGVIGTALVAGYFISVLAQH